MSGQKNDFADEFLQKAKAAIEEARLHPKEEDAVSNEPIELIYARRDIHDPFEKYDLFEPIVDARQSELDADNFMVWEPQSHSQEEIDDCFKSLLEVLLPYLDGTDSDLEKPT